MLKRVYVDNFRCLVNFELKTDVLNLFLGTNGTGKSTIFEVLRKIQRLVNEGKKVDEIFDIGDCTKWQNQSVQRFELEIAGNGGKYQYELGIGYLGSKCRIEHERLFFNGQPLLKFELGEVQLYRDNYSEGPCYPFDWSQSMLASLMPRNDNLKLTWFKSRLSRFILIKILPSLMLDESSRAEPLLTPYLENYSAWYRFISEDQGKVAEVTSILQSVIEGFSSFVFTKEGEKTWILNVRFSSEFSHESIIYRLGQLSDGQKTLLALYTLIHSIKSEDYTLCIDEPENFLALPEIQPWLSELYDLCSEEKLQALLISHHPELINYLLASPIGYWFERQSNAPARCQPISSDAVGETGLPISELIARGWLSE